VNASPRARKRGPTSFGSVLAEIESGGGDPERIARPLGYPFAAVDPLAEAADGPTSAWDQALAWVEAAAEPPQGEPARAETPVEESAAPRFDSVAPPAEPMAPLTDDPDAIAAELGLSATPTLAELSIVRRRFMWANHPDRRRDAPRELANRRVAIANMLLDRAEAALAVKRRRS
jgi:hypothetical protein